MAGLLDLLWPLVIRQESRGNPFAVSPKGAFGIGQTMPGTFRDPGFGVAPADPNKPRLEEAARVGHDYLGAMLDRYQDPKLALAAYNWGPGNLDRKGIDRAPAETRNYVQRITSQMQPMELGSAQDLPAMPPPQSPIGIGTPPIPSPFPPMGNPEPPAANPPVGINPTIQQDILPTPPAAPPPAAPSPMGQPVMADTTSDPVSQLLAQYLAQSQGGQSPGLLGQLFPALNNTKIGGFLNNSDLQSKMMNIGAGLASGHGWGPGFAAGIAGYQNQRQNDLENQRADLATKLGVLKIMGYGDEPSGYQRASGGGLTYQKGGPADPEVIAAQAKAKVNAGGAIDDETADNVAQQALAGDKTALMYWGRGATGSENVLKIRSRMFALGKQQGLTPAEISAKTAEFGGFAEGQKTIARRAASADLAAREALQIIPTVRSASGAVSRTKYPSINAVLEAGRMHTGDKNVVQLGVALNSLVNIYARAINPSGVSTEGDKNHARELLDKAWSDGQINAAVDQMEVEMNAALQSADAAKKALSKSYTQQGEDQQPTTSATPPPPPGFVVQ